MNDMSRKRMREIESSYDKLKIRTEITPNESSPTAVSYVIRLGSRLNKRLMDNEGLTTTSSTADLKRRLSADRNRGTDIPHETTYHAPCTTHHVHRCS